MYLSLLTNISIVVSMLFIAGRFFQSRPLENNPNFFSKIYVGLGTGILGTLLMINTIPINETLIVDLRHISIVIAAYVGGPISTILSATIIALMRITLYGLNMTSIVVFIIVITMGVVLGGVSLLKITKLKKFILLNILFILVNSLAIIYLVKNSTIAKSILAYHIPMSILAALLVYFMIQYLERVNKNHREIVYYKLLADNSTDIISTHNIDGTYKYISPSISFVSGYEAQELIGKKPTDFVHTEDISKIKMVFDEFKQNSKEFSIEYRFQKKDGSFLWVETTTKKMDVGFEYISSSRDITERKDIEQKLVETKDQYRHLVEYMPDPMIVHQEDKIVWANDKAAKVGYMTINQVIGTSIYNFVSPEFQPILQEQIKDLYKDPSKVFTAEMKITPTQNHSEQIDIDVTSTQITFNGKPAIQAVYRDITERKKLELKLHRTQDRFQFITENTRDLIAILDLDGTTNYMSPSCHLIIGFNYDEIVGQNIFSLIHPDDVQEVLRIQQLALDSSIDSALLLYRYRHKENDYIWLETNAKTLRNETGELEGILAVSRDVTKRKEKELQLLNTNKILENLSTLDGLTGIPNRRLLNTTLLEVWEQNKLKKMSMSILLLDIDFFKQYNDHYGHLAGDDCLIRVAKELQASLTRSNDFVARFGGEEFIVLLPETNQQDAISTAENLRKRINDLMIPHQKSSIHDYVTISIGYATIVPSDEWVPEQLINLADKALYKAKRSGRNKVEDYSLSQYKEDLN